MGSSENYTIAPTSQRPSIQIKWLFERIARKARYALESSFFETAHFKKIYLNLASEQGQTILRPTYGFKVGLINDLILHPWAYLHILPFNNETLPFYDPDAVFNSGQFSPWAIGTYTFKVHLNLISVTPSNPISHRSECCR